MMVGDAENIYDSNQMYIVLCGYRGDGTGNHEDAVVGEMYL